VGTTLPTHTPLVPPLCMLATSESLASGELTPTDLEFFLREADLEFFFFFDEKRTWSLSPWQRGAQLDKTAGSGFGLRWRPPRGRRRSLWRGPAGRRWRRRIGNWPRSVRRLHARRARAGQLGLGLVLGLSRRAACSEEVQEAQRQILGPGVDQLMDPA
jgi:hypothetical protein